MINGTQLTLADVDDEYKAFVDKFKSKKTTDDCYTPPEIYEAILGWVVKEYGIDREKVVRPFWPGGDYKRFDYPEGCTVVDNPPFSIISQICKTYIASGIRFFLFSPYLTCVGGGTEACHIITGGAITYENGAVIGTAFITNLEDGIARACPELGKIIKETDERLRKEKTRELPKYSYPDNVLTAAMLGYIAKHGVELKIWNGTFLRALDDQRAKGKTIFGGGVFIIREGSGREGSGREGSGREGSGA